MNAERRSETPLQPRPPPESPEREGQHDRRPMQTNLPTGAWSSIAKKNRSSTTDKPRVAIGVGLNQPPPPPENKEPTGDYFQDM